jgi:ParB/RepB/Spo0J family partition protein
LPATNPRSEDVAVSALLPPLIPARLAFDDVKFTELCDSIRTFGQVLQPLIVEREGASFRIHAGHRRSEAAKNVGLVTVRCQVWDAGTCQGEAVKSHENAVREDLNAAEEADYFVRLLEGQCGGDVHKLCELVRQKESYVQQRLALKLGHPLVFDALAAGLISIGVADEFNRIRSDGYIKQYLQVAAQGGCSVRQARDWRVAANNMPEQNLDLSQLPPVGESQAPPPPNSDPLCMFCGSRSDQHDIQVLFAHRGCIRVAERKADSAA